MNHNELKQFFELKLKEHTEISSRILSLKAKMIQIETMPDDSLIQMNLGTCVFSVAKDTARSLLQDQILVEQNYALLLNNRFHIAVGIINGEED